MAEIITDIFVITLFAAGIRLATPVLLTALGELLAERSGVLNLSLEGIMTAGTFAGFVAALYAGHSAGIAVGMLSGLLFGVLMAYMSVTLRADQVVTGMGLWLLGLGLIGFLFRSTLGVQIVPVTLTELQPVKIPFLGDIPILGPILFRQNMVVYFAILLVPVIGIFLFKTADGLKVTAVGENPLAADSLGVNVFRIRYACVIVGGALAGLGGAFLSLEAGVFREYMVAGRGWIAIAVVIFGNWNPYRALLGALLFGITEALQLRLQVILGYGFPVEFFYMLPYVVTIGILVLISRRAGPPAALMVPYKRGE